MIGGVQVVVAAPKISQRFVVIMEAYAVTLRKDDMDSILKALSKRSGNSGMTPTVYHWSRDDVVPDNFVAVLKNWANLHAAYWSRCNRSFVYYCV